MKRLMCAAIAALAMTACSVPKANLAADPTLSAAGEIVLRAAIRHGVSDYVGRHGPETATRVKALVDDLLLVVDSDAQTTLDALKAVAYSKIPAEFSPIDQADARDVIDLVAVAIQERIGAGALNPEALVKLRDALSWISQAAALAAPPAAMKTSPPPYDRVAIDRLIIDGEFSAHQIASTFGVDVTYVRTRALVIGAPFSRRRAKAQILADLARDLEAMESRYRDQVRAARRADPIC